MRTPTPANTEPSASVSKTLWAALLVLVVVVLAMGATLIRIQGRPVEPRMVVLPTPDPTKAAPATPKDNTLNASVAPMDKASNTIDNVASHPAVEVTARPRPVLPRTPEPALLRPPSVGASATSN
jgi:hypothetical protein